MGSDLVRTLQAKELAEEIIRRGLDHVPWGAMCRSDTLKPEVLAKLRKAGLTAVKYGVESGNQKLVDDSGELDGMLESL